MRFAKQLLTTSKTSIKLKLTVSRGNLTPLRYVHTPQIILINILTSSKNDLSTSEERNEQLENEVADLRNQVDISFKLFTHLQADTKSATYKEKHGIKSLADMAIQGKEVRIGVSCFGLTYLHPQARDESPNTSTKPIRTGPTPLWQDRQKAKLDQRDEIERIVHEARRQKKPELVQKAAKQELNSVLDEHQLEMHSQFENALTKFSTLLEDKLDTALFNHASKVDQTWFNFDNLDERLTNNANFMYGAVQHNVESQLADFTRLIRADVASAIQEATEKLVEDISDKISEKKEESLKAVAADEDYGNFETADGYKNFERRLELVQDDTAHILWLLENGPLRPTEKNEGPFTDGEEEDDWEEAVLLD